MNDFWDTAWAKAVEIIGVLILLVLGYEFVPWFHDMINGLVEMAQRRT